MHYLQGLLFGFAFVAPIGMQNIYIFNNGLAYSLRRGLLYSLCVWGPDTLFCLTIFNGMGTLLTLNQGLKLLVMILGGSLTVYIGWGIAKTAKVTFSQTELPPRTIWQALGAGFVVSWANPQAIIDGTLMLGAIRGTLTPGQSWEFFGGVITASLIWMLGMTVVFNLLKHRVPDKFLRAINLLSGLIVLGYGVVLVVKGVSQLW